jgi:glutaredoxin domain-containing cysteine-rich protein 1
MPRDASLAACGCCGGRLYVLCGSFNGSHKRYSLKGGVGFRTCA